jgi:hypothetical protein
VIIINFFLKKKIKTRIESYFAINIVPHGHPRTMHPRCFFWSTGRSPREMVSFLLLLFFLYFYLFIYLFLILPKKNILFKIKEKKKKVKGTELSQFFKEDT